MNYILGSLKVFMQRDYSTSGKLIWRMYNKGFGKRSGKGVEEEVEEVDSRLSQKCEE